MRPALSLPLALVIAGCASLTPHSEPALPLLPPASLGQPLRALQLVVSEHQGQQQKLLFAVEADGQTLVVSALTTLGVALQSISYDGAELRVDEHLPGAATALDGRWLLADLQLAGWPLAALQLAVSDAGLQPPLRVSEQPCADAHHCRTLWRDAEPLVEVRYQGADLWHGVTEIRQLQLGYRLTITTMEFAQ